ncbi:MAG TPA: hypothetical protein VGB44_10330 [Flavobacterium sp.]|jgi:cell division protein FtsW (lipid II flippase)
MSSSRKKSVTKNKNKDLALVLAAFALMGIGYYLLNHVATWEDPVLGNTFHIIAGCTLMALSGVIFFVIIRDNFLKKKKRKEKSKPVFLNDTAKQDKTD